MPLGNTEALNGQLKVSHAEGREHEQALYAKRTTEIPSNQKMRVEYDGSNNPVYVGFGPKGLAEGTDGWIIQKYTYSGSNPTERNIAYGNWTNRASYTYE